MWRWCHARLRPQLAAAVALAALAAVAASPASANATKSTGTSAHRHAAPGAEAAAITLPPGGIGQLSAQNLDELIGEDELGSTGVSATALEAPLLAKTLSHLPGITALATVNGLGGSAGVEQAMLRAIEQLAEEGELVEELVGGFGLALDFEEQLETLYEESEAAQQPGAPEDLEEAVEEALSRTPEEAIDEGLESLSLGEMLSKLIGKAAHPSDLVQALFAASDQEELEDILGSGLAGEAFTQATVAEAAAAIGITPAELAQTLGKTPTQLPETALALFTPLLNGQQLGVFAAKQGLAFGLVGEAPPPEEEPEEPEEEEEEEQEPNNGGGRPGGSGTSNGSTASIEAPVATSASSSIAPAPPAAQTVTAPAARVRIVGHKVRGANVTLVLQLSAAGRLTVSGHGVQPLHRTLTHAGRVSVTLTATRAAAASLHRHHRLKLSLRAAFVPTLGAASVATSTVTLI
jgi:hypothetical protein